MSSTLEVKSLAAALQCHGYAELGTKIHQCAFESAWTTASELLGEILVLFDEEKTGRSELKERLKLADILQRTIAGCCSLANRVLKGKATP